MSQDIIRILESMVIPNLSYVKSIKSGKEADVHLVTDQSQLYALKIYKQNANYSTQLDYLDINSVGDKRMQRAIAKGSRTGKQGVRTMWTNREYNLMQELIHYSPNIPQVFAATNEAILIEYLGTLAAPAPRLSDISLTVDEAKQAFYEIVENIELFTSVGIVHGDLSQYNILWHQNRCFIIDFPQALDIKTNPHAADKFHKDLTSIKDYFRKYLLASEVEPQFERLTSQFQLLKIYGN